MYIVPCTIYLDMWQCRIYSVLQSLNCKLLKSWGKQRRGRTYEPLSLTFQIVSCVFRSGQLKEAEWKMGERPE